MPICEADPWRLQYFAHVKTDANIPTEDCDAWLWYPARRWIYDLGAKNRYVLDVWAGS